MRRARTLSAFFLCLILSGGLTLGQSKPVGATAASPAAIAALPNPKTPAEFFARARQLSDLEAAGIPFHLKATFVASGDAEFKGNGTYEEWWKDKDHWRKEASLGSFRLVLFSSPQGPSLYASSGDIPEPLPDAMGAALIEVASDEGTAGNWRIKQKKIQGSSLTTLSGTSGPRGLNSKHLFYFASDGILRIEQSAQTTTVYNDVRPFQAQVIPRTIEKRSEQKRLLRISIGTLEPLQAGNGTTEEISTIPSGLTLIGNYYLGTTSTSPDLVYQPQPIYPASAKMERIQGRVVIGVVVDENGKVDKLRVIKSPDVSLTSASVNAVRQWRFRPMIVDGKSVAFYTTISVDYGLAFTRSYISRLPR